MNKICTSLEQSKKLIELGIDFNTADMMWDDWRLIDDGWKLFVGYDPEIEQDYGRKCYPAWSLAALLSVLSYPSLTQSVDGKWFVLEWTGKYPKTEYGYDNPIDACYEVILKLHEQNLL